MIYNVNVSILEEDAEIINLYTLITDLHVYKATTDRIDERNRQCKNNRDFINHFQ